MKYKVTKKIIRQAQAVEIEVLRSFFTREELFTKGIKYSEEERQLFIKQAKYALDVLQYINDDVWEPCLTSEELMKTFETKETT